ncbi:MAG: hypothetical protein ACRER2_12675 [Methylococcales bacterium]
MNRRLKFRCWKCERDFSLLVEIDEYPDILTECPYCSEEVLIELAPYRDKKTTVFKSHSDAEREQAVGNAFPEIIPTRKPDPDRSQPG